MTEGSTRRGFYEKAVIGLTGIISAILGLPAAAYLLVPGKKKAAGSWLEIGDLAKLPVGVPEEVEFRRARKDAWKMLNEKASAWLLRKSDTEVVAFAPLCTHLGCAYHWDQKNSNFICPCHTSAFGVNGEVLSGPAPRALDRYDVKVENGRILLGGIRRQDGTAS